MPIVCEGLNVGLSVNIPSGAGIQWIKDGKNIYGATSITLNLNSISTTAQGNYACYVTTQYSNVTSNPILIQVNTAPSINSQPHSQWVFDGSAFNLTAVIDGSKPIHFTWLKNNSVIPDSTPEIHFNSFNATNEGNYYCIALNSCGSDTTILVSLKSSPELVNVSNTSLCENDTFKLAVNFNDSAKIQWFKDGSLINTIQSKIFTINHITGNDVGNYQCRVSNANGYAVLGPVQLSMLKAPTLDSLNSITYVDATLTSVISSDSIGDGPIYYQWYKNNVPINGQIYSNLNFDSVTMNDEALYYCVVKNTCATLETNKTKLVIAPQLCMVTNVLASDSNKNMIIWTRNSSNIYDHYNIYREGYISGSYTKIGEVKFNAATSFIDSSVNPRSQAYVYKITAVDSNGIETDLNACAIHKTIHLLVTQGIPSGIQLDWDEYIGFDYKTYHVYRSENHSAFEKVNDMASTSRTWTDFDAPSEDYLQYYVTVDRATACNTNGNKKSGDGLIVESVSNLEDNRLRSTGIQNNLNEQYGLSVFPNPFDVETEIKYKLENNSSVSIKLTDLQGRIIQNIIDTKQSIGNYNYSIGNNLGKGIYIVYVMINNTTNQLKVIKIK